MEKVIIYDSMLQQKIRHCKWENEGWKRSLLHLMQELVHVKNRLANIVKNDITLETLEIIERFQNDIVEKDMVLQLMRRDVDELLTVFSSDIDEAEYKTQMHRHEKIRKEITLMEKGVGELKVEFSRSVLEKF